MNNKALFGPKWLLLLFWSSLRDFFSALSFLLELLRKRCRRRQERQRLPKRQRRATWKKCVPLNTPAYKKPDPLIYSQHYLMKLGLPVTWDNPDIQLYKDGAPIPSSHLEADTEYEIIARIWNNSTDAPVVDLPVRFYYLSFGVGTQRHPIGDTQVTLGVKGGPNHPAFAKMKWKTPPTPGHYCIQVFLDWSDDANPDNNLGQENVHVYEVHSPVHFTFALRNDTYERQHYRFTVDAYKLSLPLPCDSKGRKPEETAVGVGKVAMFLNDYPLPEGWSVEIEPQTPVLAPGEEISIGVTVNVPDDFHGKEPVNIHVFNNDGLAGGVTVYIERR